MIFAEYKGHMGHRMNEIVIGQNTFIHEGSPELTRNLELLIDTQGFIGAYFSVGTSGGVIQLAQCRVTGASVIPRVRGFLRRFIEAFQKNNIPGGFQFLQKDTKRCAHDTAAHKDDIGLFSTCYH